MTAQWYPGRLAQDRMRNGRCPECGQFPSEHLDSVAFWVPRPCNLTVTGAQERIDFFAQERNRSGDPDAVVDAGPDGPASTEE